MEERMFYYKYCIEIPSLIENDKNADRRTQSVTTPYNAKIRSNNFNRPEDQSDYGDYCDKVLTRIYYEYP
uniref:Uncharacterized protein n=1 Tax=Glossina palpalis gambiensis TaxID=67801 RepID=A0A1B0BPN2_9MUSC